MPIPLTTLGGEPGPKSKEIEEVVDSTVVETNVEATTLRESPESISGELQDVDRTRQALLFRYGYINNVFLPWIKFTKELNRRFGLDVGATYSVLFQHASKTLPGKEDNAASGVLDIFGHWNLLGIEDTKNPGFIGFRVKWAHKLFSDVTPTNLNEEIGSLWQTATSFNQQTIFFTQFWWQQSLFNGKVKYRIGKVDQTDFIDFFRLGNAKRFFLNEAFTQNPTIPYPPQGLLGFVTLRPSDEFYLLFSMGDLNARASSLELKSFFADREFFYAAELNLSPLAKKLGHDGNYSITLWHSDKQSEDDIPDSNGFAVSLDELVSDKLEVFLRYSYSDGDVTDLKQLISFGMGMYNPLKFRGDFLGIAFAWGEPSNNDLRSQYVLEGFYRIQLALAQLTPDIQLIVNPTNNPEEDLIVVLGLRLRIAL